MKLTYTGLLGTLDINSKDITLLEGHDFYDYSYTIKSHLKMGGVGELLDRVTLPSKKYSFSLLIKKNKLQEVRDLFEADISANKPGKLELNDSYVSCYISESKQKKYTRYSNVVILTFVATVLTPLWITEVDYEFSIHNTGESLSGFKLPTRLPMRFVASDSMPVLVNDGGTESLAEIVFYGPAIKPKMIIDNVPYQIEGVLLENERFVINQMNKTIVKITESGDIINVFHLRQKTPSVFTPIPKGENMIVFDRTFSLKIKLFKGSVQPQWN